MPVDCPSIVETYLKHCVPPFPVGGPVLLHDLMMICEEFHDDSTQFVQQGYLPFAFTDQDVLQDVPLCHYLWSLVTLEIIECRYREGNASVEDHLEQKKRSWTNIREFLEWLMTQQPAWMQMADELNEKAKFEDELKKTDQAKFEPRFFSMPDYGLTEEGFWQLIHLSKRDFLPDRLNGNQKRQIELLEELLIDLPPKGIWEFEKMYLHLHGEVYNYYLWDAYYILGGWYSDDGFSYCRDWLISMGRENFYRVLEDADNMVTLVQTQGVECLEFHDFSYVAKDTFKKKTGVEMPDFEVDYPNVSGSQTPKNEMKDRFPKCWAVRGQF